ncbi:MAG: endonuclease G [Pseudohongiellaceae bacterium]
MDLLKTFSSTKLIQRVALATFVTACWPAFSLDIRNSHCFAGCPVGAGLDNSLIIRSIYTLSHNAQTKVSDWAAYSVSIDSIGIGSNLSRQARPDNYVSSTLDIGDFPEDDSGPFLLGRLVPLLNFAGTPFWQDTNYTSNAIPISRSLNTGAWNGLDWSIRNLVNRVGQVFVITGPIYFSEPQVKSLETMKQHQVPDAFFKVVISESGESSVFLLNQQVQVHTHHCSLLSTMVEVERLTGLVLLADSNQLSGGSLDAALGCN